MGYDEEFATLFRMVQGRLPSTKDHYMCPRGPVGVPGPIGPPGVTEELTEVIIDETPLPSLAHRVQWG